MNRLGMKIDTYVQWDTMMYETFFAEEPPATEWVQCDQWGQPIHLVNYNTRQLPFIENIKVKCALPEGKSASAVRLYSADLDDYDELNFHMQDANAVFTIPKLNAYCMVAATW